MKSRYGYGKDLFSHCVEYVENSLSIYIQLMNFLIRMKLVLILVQDGHYFLKRSYHSYIKFKLLG